MKTLVEIHYDEQSVVGFAPAVEVIGNSDPTVVEVITPTNETQATDPLSGNPYAVMMNGGRHIFVSELPPPPGSGQIVGDLWFPFPT